MTPAKIRSQIEAASARLTSLQTELERKDALLRSGRDVNGDGRFDERDTEAVARVRARRDAAQTRIDGLLHKLILAEAREDETPVEYISFEDEGEYIKGENHRKLFTADRNAFKSQISGWRTDVRESLSHMVNTMLDPNDPGPGFPKNEIIGLASTALTATQPQFAAALGVANTLLDLAVNAYKHSLPTTPSLREIEVKWRASIDAVDDAAAEAQYDKLVELFIRENHMDSDEQYIYHTYIDEWDKLIDEFRAGKVLPDGNSIKRAFMKHIMAEMPDSIWDMDNTSGEVTIYMEFDMEKNDFSFSSGSIDDLTDEVKGALKAAPDLFGSNGVISLPLPIRFNVSGAGFMQGKFCELYRPARTSGSTDFQFTPTPINAGATLEEQGTMFQIFMQRRIYERVSVTQILN